jgi:predicted aspartyl protease
MITGTIEQSLYPHIVLSIFDQGRLANLEFLVDSGFDDEVALSYNQADLFKLEIQDYVKVTYASGEWENELIAQGKIVWFGKEREVRVILSDDEEPAIGTKLLKGCVMTMDFIQDALTIDKPA